MSLNKNLHSAKKAKNDEFYTRIEDIENELRHYKEHFKDKVVFCNCDDPEFSNFWKHFVLDFEHLGLKKLISTHYNQDGTSYKLEFLPGDSPMLAEADHYRKTPLKGDGDFRSDECVELLEEADIVVTNPPFSLFREYVSQLMEYDKKFLIIGSDNAITYKDVFSHIKNNNLWLGVMKPKAFIQPDGEIKKFGNISWFTNLPHKKRNEEIILYKKYYGNEDDYPTYDNYDAIEVSTVKYIPEDYYGYMGVPITFMTKFNPEQFEIVWTTDRGGDGQLELLKKNHIRFDAPVVNGNGLYKRIIIRRKQ